MNDVSQRTIFAMVASLVVSGGVAFAAAFAPAQSPSPALAQKIPSLAMVKFNARANDALALDGQYGCASGLAAGNRGANPTLRAVSDCD